MRGFWLWVPLLGVSVAAAGCSSGSADGGMGGASSGPVTTAAGFCDGTFGAVVDYVEQTCSAQDKQSDSYLFVWGLLQGAVEQCSTVLQSSIDKGRAAINTQAATSCVDGYRQAIAAAGSFDSLDKAVSEQLEQACTSAITGSQQIGAACAQPYECIDGATCVGYTSTADGTCQTPALGEACGKGESTSGEMTFNFSFGNHPECASGYCDSIYENGEFIDRCVALKAAGEDCYDEEQCQSGLRCQLGVCSTDGPAQVGGACQVNDDCSDGLYCTNDTNLCAAKKKTGETCAAGAFGGNECEGTCQAPEGADTGACAPFCGSG